MADILDLPNTPRRYDRTYVLDAVELTLTLWWHDRASRWYADVALADGTLIEQGAPLVPGIELLANPVCPDLPDGRFIVVGDIDPYPQSALGESLFVIYVPSDEVESLALVLP